MTSWYMLHGPVSQDCSRSIPELTARDPRTIPVSRAGDGTPLDVLDGASRLNLVKVQPNGGVTLNRDGWPTSSKGWTTTGPAPTALLLGPQHQQLAVLHDAIRNVSPKTAAAYTWIVDTLCGEAGMRESRSNACWFAIGALERLAGADGEWWRHLMTSPYGPVLLAVAARDLIGPAPRAGWSQAAYELLTGPWTAAAGEPAHPDDIPLAERDTTVLTLTRARPRAAGAGRLTAGVLHRQVAGQAASAFGDAMFTTAIMLWVSQHLAAGQPWMPAACGGIAACSYTVIILAAPVVQFTDRFPPRTVMQVTETVRFAVAAITALAAFLPATVMPAGAWLLVVYLVTGVLTGAGQVFTPARMSAVRQLTGPDGFAKHTAATAAASAVAAVAGAAISAPVTITVGPQAGFAVDAVTFGVSWLMVRHLPPVAPSRGGDRGRGFGLRDAVILFRRSRYLVRMLGVTCTCQAGTGTFTALGIVTVTTNLHAAPAAYGELDAVLGAGCFTGAVLAVRLARRIPHRTLITVGLLAAAAGLGGYAWCRTLPSGLILLALYWTAIGVLVPATEPVLVDAAPDGAVARVMAVSQSVNQAVAALSVVASGALVSGPLRGVHPAGGGPATIVLTAGAGFILLAACIAARKLPARLKPGTERAIDN